MASFDVAKKIALPLSSWSRWRSWLRQIERRGAELPGWDDVQLRKAGLALQYRAQTGEPLDHLLVESFALTREAGRRVLGMQHYDVQLLGGMAMHHGAIVEMQTGEGKTLTATLPLVLAALTRRGTHVATANDYLANRDAELMRPLYESLGLQVGVVQSSSSPAERQQAYACPITYGTAKEFGFDFLRERMQRRQDNNHWLKSATSSEERGETAAIPRYFALVDEADALLIDEARTPLVVSAMPEPLVAELQAAYRWACRIAPEFAPERDFAWDPGRTRVQLTATGRRRVRQQAVPEAARHLPLLDLYSHVELALLVRQQYQRDRHYIVRGDEVVIVDEFTGRLSEGRRWREGIHQAIEAQEGLEVSADAGQAARITIQNFFLRYERLAGMTGTAANSQSELRQIYRLNVVAVPTHRPPRRELLPARVYGTDREKWLAIVEEVRQVHETGRPVLVGTRSIDRSQQLAELLTQAGIEHQVLNAHHAAEEADRIRRAGLLGAVTVATNMAGRGTDIRLGPGVEALGGLHVIGTELHESQRIDRQLIGRCGRQGDPGSFRQFLSFEDEILAAGFGTSRASRWQRRGTLTLGPIPGAETLFRRAQRRVERRHARQRKQLMQRERHQQSLHRQLGQDPYLDALG